MRPNKVEHPARFSDAILPVIERHLIPGTEGLDPFAGTGRIHQLTSVKTWGVEIEPEWADMHPRTIVGDALRLPFADGAFDWAATSPCLAQHHRVLTDDLRWVAVGDMREGDRLLAFDEEARNNRGVGSRRRWQRTEVVRSVARKVRCVRVILANGDEMVTTPEHPWLSWRYAYGSSMPTWVQSQYLMGAKGTSPWHVGLQVRPWIERASFDAGWLAGLFDGEGSLSLGVHGSPKMTLCQVDGAVLDRAERLMVQFGYEPNRLPRKGVPDHRQPISNLYVTGGFPGMLKALGELRPMRLIDKWLDLDVSTRTVQAQKVAVVAVEDAGWVDIQEIETESGTYIGEGYLHHNCYGNRMADSHNAQERCKACQGTGGLTQSLGGVEFYGACEKCAGTGRRRYRRLTYTHLLGRKLHENNSGAMQWGPKYRAFHEAAWREVWRVLREPVAEDDPVRFILNISNHVRAGEVVPVMEWHVEAIEGIGFVEVAREPVKTPRMGFGDNHNARVENEWVIVFEKPMPVAA